MKSIEFGQVYKAPNLRPIPINAKTLAELMEQDKFRAAFIPAKGVHVGIEYEIENCPLLDRVPEDAGNWDAFHRLWTITTDNSLRNSGAEFVSKPVKDEEILAALAYLHHYLRHWRKTTKVSHRTGIHVHVNASDLNIPQIFAWIGLYQVFERMLYKYSGERDENIYCLPTDDWAKNFDTGIRVLPHNQADALRVLSETGLKYAGMNTIPLRVQGTLEFRQMQTTKDISKIGYWVDFLTHVKTFAANNVIDLDSLVKFYKTLGELNTSSKYGTLLTTVFPHNSDELKYAGWEQDMAKGIIQVKENLVALLKAIEESKKQPPPAQRVWTSHDGQQFLRSRTIRRQRHPGGPGDLITPRDGEFEVVHVNTFGPIAMNALDEQLRIVGTTRELMHATGFVFFNSPGRLITFN